jgi:hypothetical protein
MGPVEPGGQGRQLVELRSYSLVPGGAAAFVEHFEAHFLDSQAQLGMDVVGLFTVPGDDARFVWVRRFLDPSGRGEALGSFYGGPVWAEFGPRANELMIDYTDVHLLWPDPSLPGLALADGVASDTTVVAATFALPEPADLAPEVAAAMTDALADQGDQGVRELARLVTAGVANDFPLLPVHEDRPVAVWLLAGEAAGGASAAAASVAHRCGLGLRTDALRPTARSRLR